jgi:hypothetical protein
MKNLRPQILLLKPGILPLHPLIEPSTLPIRCLAPLYPSNPPLRRLPSLPLPLREMETKGQHRGGLEENLAMVSLQEPCCLS